MKFFMTCLARFLIAKYICETFQQLFSEWIAIATSIMLGSYFYRNLTVLAT